MIQNVTAESCVAFAVETEETGAKLYQALARKFAADGDLAELFAEMGRDELRHAEQIRAMGERLAPRFRDRPVSAEERDYLRAMSIPDLASTAAGLAAEVDAVRSREDALKRSLRFEKATLAWYRAVRDLAGPEEVLDSLIAMERKHVVKVMALLVGEAMLKALADSA